METKICIDCGKEKELHNFTVSGPNKSFRRNKCKSCVRKWNALPKEDRDRIKEEQKDIIRTKIEKVCPTCKILKPREAFYKKVSSSDGMSAECKLCDDHRHRERHDKFVTKTIKGLVDIPIEQTCIKCNTTKTIRNFSKSVNMKTGYSSICKTCAKLKWHSLANTERRIKWLYNRIKAKCNQLDIEFDLELSDIVIPDVCPILGIPLRFGKSDKGYTSNADESSPSVDRIDPNGGYVKDNIIIISWRANRLKGNASIQELILLAEFYKKYLPK